MPTAIPETMRAVGFREHGSIDALELLDVDVPAVDPDGVLIDVKATSLNHADVFVVRDLEGYVPEYPHWGGMDFAGVVAETGADVTDWAAGSSRPGRRPIRTPRRRSG